MYQCIFIGDSRHRKQITPIRSMELVSLHCICITIGLSCCQYFHADAWWSFFNINEFVYNNIKHLLDSKHTPIVSLLYDVDICCTAEFVPLTIWRIHLIFFEGFLYPHQIRPKHSGSRIRVRRLPLKISGSHVICSHGGSWALLRQFAYPESGTTKFC